MKWRITVGLIAACTLVRCATAAEGAALLKTDIMGVFAHPDDETGMAATLAYYAIGKERVVANIYCTRGEGGGNMVGTHWGSSLGVLREAELRDCLATLGVRYCYFLDQQDWAYTESVAATLEKWGKEKTLERLVRLVRALRPEVIVTMNPAPSPGQHGHHQAAGWLATEAFAAAADPARFPLQLSKEGLSVWQARRLFYGGANSNQLAAVIGVSEPMANGQSPARIAAKALANHRSQAFGNFGDSPWLQRPQWFLLVKAFVPNAGLEKDLLAGLPASELSAQPLSFGERPAPSPIVTRFIPRAAVANYERWVAEQGIEHAATQFRADLTLVGGEKNSVQIEVQNNSPAAVAGELTLTVPKNWRVEPGSQQVSVEGNKKRSVSVQITPPDAGRDEEIIAAFNGTPGGTRIHLVPRAPVAKLPSPPKADDWERLPALAISPAQLVQGRVANPADSSASFRLAHDGRTLFLDVQVKDNLVVSNIAPNDIRGHWRSDSIEICLDPAVGAENTMGSYKIGIFPFDSTGVVRAARDADANQGPIEETAPDTRISSERTSDGYRVQAAIPFSEIGLKPGQKRLGFNLIIYDGDKADAAPGENINKSRIAWAPRPGVQGRPEDWGRIDLE